MSWTAFSAELHPDPKLRLWVLLSGGVLAVLGLLVAVLMPVETALRVVLAAGWALICARELRLVRKGYAAAGALRLAGDGSLRVRLAGGRWRPASLRPGCIVTARFAWLRISVAAGPRYVELLAGDIRENENWRRLQVIWRHLGATI